MRASAVLSVILLLSQTVCFARTWYVTSDGLGDAPTIGAGVDSASAGDTVLVGCGTYYEGIALKEGITLLSEGGQADCVTLDGQHAYRLLGCASCDSLTMVKGFTITRGLDSNPVASSGGGLWCVQSHGLVVENCNFIDNWAEFGAAVYCEYCSPTFINCIFGENGGASFGGAFCLSIASPFLEKCTFIENSAGYGGAICCYVQSSPVIVNCTFYGNDGHYLGGGIYCYQLSTPAIEKTVIANSTAGSSIWCEDEWSAPTLACCDVYGNKGGDWTELIAEQLGTNGNFSADPRFCDTAGGDFTLEDCSPCLPGNHPDGYDCGDSIGASGSGCVCDTATEPASWGKLKAIYR
jgi:hypothetical protein